MAIHKWLTNRGLRGHGSNGLFLHTSPIFIDVVMILYELVLSHALKLIRSSNVNGLTKIDS